MKFNNKTIWIYWEQGWENTPPLVTVCLRSWETLNPDWNIVKLTRDNLINYVDLHAEIEDLENKKIQLAHKSDILRLSLLYHYGGVWVDATCMCRIPLDVWIHTFTPYDFFAFERPGYDRAISTWFLAANKGSYLIKTWYLAHKPYWKDRIEADNYFWNHFLFNKIIKENPTCYDLWQKTPKMSARPPHYITKYRDTFHVNSTPAIEDSIRKVQSPVFKLTYKYEQPETYETSLLFFLLNKSQTPHKPTVSIIDSSCFKQKQNDNLPTIVSLFLTHGFNFTYSSDKPLDNSPDFFIPLNELNPTQADIVIFNNDVDFVTNKAFTSFFEQVKNKYTIGVNLNRKLNPAIKFDYNINDQWFTDGLIFVYKQLLESKLSMNSIEGKVNVALQIEDRKSRAKFQKAIENYRKIGWILTTPFERKITLNKSIQDCNIVVTDSLKIALEAIYQNKIPLYIPSVVPQDDKSLSKSTVIRLLLGLLKFEQSKGLIKHLQRELNKWGRYSTDQIITQAQCHFKENEILIPNSFQLKRDEISLEEFSGLTT